MSRLSSLNSPLLLGFEQFERIRSSAKGLRTDTCPITSSRSMEAASDYACRRRFHADELDITVENNQLTIRGQKVEDDEDRVFLHRGIASRQFQRTFVLADGIEVTDAGLSNGLLNIDLARPEPAVQVRKIGRNPKSLDYGNDASDVVTTKRTGFRSPGPNQVAYIQAVQNDTENAYVVRAANGTDIAEMADLKIAVAAVRQHDMEPLSVH